MAAIAQERLGKAAGLGGKFIGVIERGEKAPSFDAIAKLADALGVECYEFFVPLRKRTPVGPEFARQVGWLRRNFDYLCRSPIQNPFRVLVDEKYRDAAECQSLKPTLSPTLGITLWWVHWKHLTSMLNVQICRAREKKEEWMPIFTEFRFEKDENSVYLQAADLLSNLFYNALKFEKGIRSEKTPLKNKVLRTIYYSSFEARLLDALEVVTRTDVNGETHELLVLKDMEFSGRMTLLPQPAA